MEEPEWLEEKNFLDILLEIEAMEQESERACVLIAAEILSDSL